jgi:hypothetical protein
MYTSSAARIRVEQIIRDDETIEAYEILELQVSVLKQSIIFYHYFTFRAHVHAQLVALHISDTGCALCV